MDSPREGFIANIPVEFIRNARKYDRKPDIAHGQAHFWYDGKGSVQGVTELPEVVRTEDEWLSEIQNEKRSSALLKMLGLFCIDGKPRCQGVG